MGVPPLVSMFNSSGAATRRTWTAAGKKRKRHQEPLRPVVQRQRDPGAVLDSRGDRARLPTDAMPDASGAAA